MISDFNYYRNDSIQYLAQLIRISEDQAQKLIDQMVSNGFAKMAQIIVERDTQRLDPEKARNEFTELYGKFIHEYRFNQKNIDEAVRYVCEVRCGLKVTDARKLASILTKICIYCSYRYGDSIAHCEFPSAKEIHKAINAVIRQIPDIKKQIEDHVQKKRSRGETDYKAVYDAIYKYLRKHEFESFTYNKLSTILGLHCGTTRNVLIKLVNQGKIISYKPRESKKKLVYKYADRGNIVKKYGAGTNAESASVKMAAVKDAIVQIIKNEPGISTKAIYQQVRNYYGKMDDKTSSQALAELIQENAIIRELTVSRGNSKTYAHHTPITDVEW